VLEFGHDFQEALCLLFRAEAHDALDACAVVPAAIEDRDLARRGEVRHVALKIHLCLLPLGRGRQGDDVKYAWADALGDRLDRAAFAGPVAAFEHHADFLTRLDDPLLQQHQLCMQLGELALVDLARQPLDWPRLNGVLRRCHGKLPCLT
jgi:hypothetical protein